MDLIYSTADKAFRAAGRAWLVFSPPADLQAKARDRRRIGTGALGDSHHHPAALATRAASA